MPEKNKSFFLIKYHTDAELSAFLQSKAEDGFALVKVKGNTFYFENKPYDKRRVCALTLYRTGGELSTEMQVREQLPFIRKNGWDCITVGKQETLKDTRRHVYLIEEKPGSDLPVSDARMQKRAQIRGKFKALSNALLCTLYLIFFSFLLSTSLTKIVTGNFYIFCTALFALLLAVSCVLCFWTLADVFFINRKPHLLDVSTKFISVLLVFLFAFLICDVFVQDRGRAERIKIGTSVYHLYSDSIPVDLEDLGFDASLPYRTTRHTESSSFLASSSYCFDESFGIKEADNIYESSSVSGVLFVSYTRITSKFAFIRNAAVFQNSPKGSVRDRELEKKLKVDEAYTLGTVITLCKGDSVMLIKSGVPLTEMQLEKIAVTF